MCCTVLVHDIGGGFYSRWWTSSSSVALTCKPFIRKKIPAVDLEAGSNLYQKFVLDVQDALGRFELAPSWQLVSRATVSSSDVKAVTSIGTLLSCHRCD